MHQVLVAIWKVLL